MSFTVKSAWKACAVNLMEDRLQSCGYTEAKFEFLGENQQLIESFELAPCSYESVREALDSIRAAGFEQKDITGIREITNIYLKRG